MSTRIVCSKVQAKCDGVSWSVVMPGEHALLGEWYLHVFFLRSGHQGGDGGTAVDSCRVEESSQKLRKISVRRSSLWGVTSRWFLEPYPKGNQSIDGDTGRRCWTCSSLCSILRLTTLERAGDGRWWSDGMGFLVFLLLCSMLQKLKHWESLMHSWLSDYQTISM